MSRFLRACRRRPPVYRSGVLFHTPTHARMHARAHRPHVHTRGTRHERDAGKPPRAQGCARQHCTPPPPLPKLELAALPWQQDVSEGEERTRAGEERTGARRTNRRRQSAPDISRSRTTCMCPSIHTQRHPTPQAHTHHQRRHHNRFSPHPLIACAVRKKFVRTEEERRRRKMRDER
jgi:hypothetical protein